MKKLCTLLFLLTALFSTGRAGEVNLGYCNGVVNRSGNVGASGRAWVDAAIVLPSSLLQPYTGNNITKVRVGLATALNVDTLKVWLRSTLDGENLAEGEILKSAIVRGWNEVPLSAAYKVASADKPLYVGYSFKQRGTINAISYVSEAVQGAFWVKLGSGEQWKDMSSQGALSLEAVMTGDNVFSYDIGISNQVASNISNSNDISVTAVLKNYGTETVTKIDLLVGGSKVADRVPVSLDVNLPSGVSEEKTFVVKGLPASSTLANTIYMSVDKVNGKPDENPANDNVELPFAHERKVLLEEFTSESCQNCPRMAANVHSVIHSDEFHGRAVVVAHHDGFSTDFLSLPSDTEYTWFYNKATTYAPALMIDRYPYFKTTEKKPTPVSNLDADEIKEALRDRLAVPTYTRLSIAAEPLDDDNLHVKVTGFRARPFCDTPARITLYLLEDSIAPRRQQGATPGFRHMHVERVINSTWGVVIEWKEDGTFEYEYNMKIADGWDRNQLSLVAVIGGYDADDLTNCVVENAEELHLRGILPTGINAASVTDAAETSRETYSLSGVRIDNAAAHNGVVIVKRRFADGTVKVTKQVVK